MATMSPAKYFPPVDEADEQGVLGFGGQLTCDWLTDAYTHGIFPWPMWGHLVWCSPDPRGVIELDALHVSRSLRRTLRKSGYRLTRDTAFREVMVGCATSLDRTDNTWIIPPLVDAYVTLHRRGVAHSVEVWRDERLVGGVYGVSFGAMFAAESMFYRERDASKVALVHLVEHLRQRGYRLLDIQVLNEHTETLGGTEIARDEFLVRLAEALQLDVTF